MERIRSHPVLILILCTLLVITSLFGFTLVVNPGLLVLGPDNTSITSAIVAWIMDSESTNLVEFTFLTPFSDANGALTETHTAIGLVLSIIPLVIGTLLLYIALRRNREASYRVVVLEAVTGGRFLGAASFLAGC